VAAVAPLFVLIGLVGWLLELRVAGYAAWGIAALAGIVLLMGYLVSRLEGQKNAV
jgi:hypothetical protein